MTTIDKDIAEAIDKSLPAMIGERLRERLALIDTLEAKIAKHEEAAKTSLRVLGERDATILDMQRRAKWDSELAGREQAVALREAKVNLIELQLKLEIERRQEIKGLVDTIFRSPVYQNRLSGTVPMVLPGFAGGNGTYPVSPSVSQGHLDTTGEVRQV
jgi:hypothetical protein